MNAALFTFGLLATLAFWPGTLDAALTSRWVVMAVGAPLLLLFVSPDTRTSIWRPALAVAAAGATLAWTPDFLNGLDELVHLMILLGVFWLGASLRNLRPIWLGFASGVAVSAVIAMAQVIGWTGIDQAAVPGGLFVNKNFLGEVAMVALLVSAYYRWYFLAAMAALAVVLAASKAVFMALCTVALAICFKRSRLGFCLIGSIIAGAVFAVLWDHPSVTSRVDIWAQTLNAWSWKGHGLGSYATMFPLVEFAHSEYAQFLWELGVFSIPGFLFLIYLSGRSFSGSVEEFVLIALGTVALVAFPLHLPATAFAAALAAGHLARSRMPLRLGEYQGRAGTRSASRRETEAAGTHLGFASVFGGRLPQPTRTTDASRLEGSSRAALRSFTRDDATVKDKRERFYTVEKIGPQQALTPEGFLLCEEVPIARTGQQMYGPDEVPVAVGPNGVVMIERDAKEVFRPEFVASFAGKPVVNDHPDRDVTPENWKKLIAGVTLNPRQGTGNLADLLIADLLICEPEAIQAVRSGKREVSCGYDAEYEEIEPGHGRQYDMVGNHVALVESGRCGPRCAIGDRAQPSTTTHKTGDRSMKPNARFTRALDKVRSAFKSRDEASLEAALGEAEDAIPEEESTHIHLDTAPPAAARGMTDEDIEGRFRGIEDGIRELSERLDSAFPPKKDPAEDADPAAAHLDVLTDAAKEEKVVEDNLEEEAPAGIAKDAARKAKDSAFLGDSFQETVSLAEILVPGIRVPAYDRSAKPKDTLDAICRLRRTALDLAFTTPDNRQLIEDALAGKPLRLADMDCRNVRTLFRTVGLAKKAANGRGNLDHRSIQSAGGGLGAVGKIRTPAEMNAKLAEYYAPKKQ